MKVGVTLFAQNYVDWERFEAVEADPSKEGLPQLVPDGQIYREQFHLGGLVEPLGFDSLWTVEHHFTPYTMITSPTQFLAYFAGQTKRIGMGTMIVVLPWHDPVQVAEGYIALDYMLDGASSRWASAAASACANTPACASPWTNRGSVSRSRSTSSAMPLRRSGFRTKASTTRSARTSMRPTPRPGNTLAENIYIAWGSPQSMPVAAHENIKPLFIPQRSWEDHRGELAEYNNIRESHGWGPERPSVVCWVYCAETDAEGEAGARQYMAEYADSAARHYQFIGEHLQGLKGYEYYAQMAKMAAALPPEVKTSDLYFQNHVWGSPKTCIEKLQRINDLMGADEFVAVFSYGAMPVEKAEASMRLFAREVLPTVQKFAPAAVPAGQRVRSRRWNRPGAPGGKRRV